MIIRTFAAVGLMLLLWSCSPSAPARLTDADQVVVRAAVRERMNEYLEAVRRQDLDWMLGFWADTDAFVFAGDGSLIAGYDSFVTQLRGASAATAAVLSLTNSNEHIFVLARDAAALSLEFEGSMVTVAGDTLRSRGAWTYVFKQFADGWKVVHSAGTHLPASDSEPRIGQ